MTKLRVMHLIGSLQLGGAEKLTATIVKNLDPEQFTTSVCCLRDVGYYGDQLRERGFPVYELNISKSRSLRSLINTVRSIFRLRSLIIKNRIDVVHTHVFGTGIIGRIAAKLARVPIIVHTTHRLNLYGPAETWFEKALMRITNAYVVDSNAVRQAISSQYAINTSKIFVIYNGIDPAEFGNLLPKETARNKLGLPQDMKVISIIAHMTKRKAHQVYIRAFAKALLKYPNVCLMLVGDGQTRQDLEQLVHNLCITDNIYFLGYREDLACILAATDILAHPSEWEGFGIILAEAMYCEIPVITTNAGGGSEVISHHETGILVPLGDIDGFTEATLSLLNNDELASQYGKAGRRRVVEYFLKSKMVDQYEQFYQQLVSAYLKNRQDDQ